MSKNTAWLETVMRSRSVAPTYGFGMGDVCPQAAATSIAATPMWKRHLDAVQATPGSAHVPWSPPVP
jgi:hypothetical protein